MTLKVLTAVMLTCVTGQVVSNILNNHSASIIQINQFFVNCTALDTAVLQKVSNYLTNNTVSPPSRLCMFLILIQQQTEGQYLPAKNVMKPRIKLYMVFF